MEISFQHVTEEFVENWSSLEMGKFSLLIGSTLTHRAAVWSRTRNLINEERASFFFVMRSVCFFALFLSGCETVIKETNLDEYKSCLNTDLQTEDCGSPDLNDSEQKVVIYQPYNQVSDFIAEPVLYSAVGSGEILLGSIILPFGLLVTVNDGWTGESYKGSQISVDLYDRGFGWIVKGFRFFKNEKNAPLTHRESRIEPKTAEP